MDPLGFALENFDATGRWRTSTAGVPIDAVGALPDGTRLEGPQGLRAVLAAHSVDFTRTVTSKLLTYALGRSVEATDLSVVRSITRAASNNGYKWSSVILEIVKSQPFQMRRAES
jgi:hypothetical protein